MCCRGNHLPCPPCVCYRWFQNSPMTELSQCYVRKVSPMLSRIQLCIQSQCGRVSEWVHQTNIVDSPSCSPTNDKTVFFCTMRLSRPETLGESLLGRLTAIRIDADHRWRHWFPPWQSSHREEEGNANAFLKPFWLFYRAFRIPHLNYSSPSQRPSFEHTSLTCYTPLSPSITFSLFHSELKPTFSNNLILHFSPLLSLDWSHGYRPLTGHLFAHWFLF